MTLHFFGDRTNPSLVLLHGIGVGHRLWLRQIAHFQHSHFVIAPDLPGFTGVATASQPDIVEIAKGLTAQLAMEDLGHIALCGISAGASVAIATAARMGGGVSHLILSAPQARAPRFMLGLQIAVSAMMPEKMLIAAVSQLTKGDPEINAAALADGAALGKRGLLAAMRALKQMDLRPMLSHITAPASVFCGEKDPVNLPAARHIAATLRDACLSIEPSAGHLWNMQMPERFNEAVEKALARPSLGVRAGESVG